MSFAAWKHEQKVHCYRMSLLLSDGQELMLVFSLVSTPSAAFTSIGMTLSSTYMWLKHAI
jgi:hypothetical protein